MNDIAGNELAIGDKVAYTKTPNKNNKLRFGWEDRKVECKFPTQVAKLFN